MMAHLVIGTITWPFYLEWQTMTRQNARLDDWFWVVGNRGATKPGGMNRRSRWQIDSDQPPQRPAVRRALQSSNTWAPRPKMPLCIKIPYTT